MKGILRVGGASGNYYIKKTKEHRTMKRILKQ
jgi:hypothetical protein